MPRFITSNKIELLNFLKQNVIRKLLEEANRQHRSKTDLLVIATVVQYFNLGPAPHGLFYNTVHQIAHSFWGEWFSTFEPFHVTPQMIIILNMKDFVKLYKLNFRCVLYMSMLKTCSLLTQKLRVRLIHECILYTRDGKLWKYQSSHQGQHPLTSSGRVWCYVKLLY